MRDVKAITKASHQIREESERVVILSVHVY